MSDALSRINLSKLSGIGASSNRKRVPPRDKSLLGASNVPTETMPDDIEQDPEPIPGETTAQPLPTVTSNVVAQTKVAQPTSDLPTVKATIFRVEENLYDTLTSWCQQHRVTRETFLEAAILAAQADETIKAELLNVAASRCHRRKQAKEQRKAMTLAAKYNY